MVEIQMIEAGTGDCFFIKNKDKNILIDGGFEETYEVYLKEIIKNKKLDLVVISHVHDDHMEGIKTMFEDKDFDLENIEKIWYNSGFILGEENENRKVEIKRVKEKKSIAKGILLEDQLKKLECWHETPIKFGHSDDIGGFKIEVLAPFEEELKKLNSEWDNEIEKIKKENKQYEKKSGTKDDYGTSIETLLQEKETRDNSFINRSSIVLLITIGIKKMLFTGDTSSDILIKALKEKGYSEEHPLKLDILKVPHHGSKKNISRDFLRMIECKKFLISANGKEGRHKHPNKECLVKIMSMNADKKIEFIFNYGIINEIFSVEEQKKYTNVKFNVSSEIKL